MNRVLNFMDVGACRRSCSALGFESAQVILRVAGAIDTAEERILKGFGEQVVFLRMGEGYTWETQNRERDTRVAQEAWAEVEKFLKDPGFGLIVLDELNIAIHHEYVSLKQVLTAVGQRPPMQHVVITGRGASPELIEAADLVSEMKMIKHPFRKGIKAQAGIEF